MAEYVEKAKTEFALAWGEVAKQLDKSDVSGNVDPDVVDRLLKASDRLSEVNHKYGHTA